MFPGSSKLSTPIIHEVMGGALSTCCLALSGVHIRDTKCLLSVQATVMILLLTMLFTSIYSLAWCQFQFDTSNQCHFVIKTSLFFNSHKLGNSKIKFQSIFALSPSNLYRSKCTHGGQRVQTNSWGVPERTPHINYSVRSPSLHAVSILVFPLAVEGPALPYTGGRRSQGGGGQSPVDSLTRARRGLEQEYSLKSPQEHRHRRG